MSVLPQLEQELRTAHERRRRAWRPLHVVPKAGQWLALAMAVGVVAAVVVIAASLRSHHHTNQQLRVSTSMPRTAWPRIALPGARSVIGYAAGGSLYVAEGGEQPTTLMRINAQTGVTEAETSLDQPIVQMLRYDGDLWVTTTSYPEHEAQTMIWRLAPSSLSVRSRLVLPRAGPFGSGSVAAAGGWIWASDGYALFPIDPSTGVSTRSAVQLVGAKGAGVAADQTGRVLLVSVGNGSGIGYVQRRNPGDGVLEATSGRFEGATRPAVGGIIDGGVWFSEAGGMQGNAGRLDLRTLRQTRTQTPQVASNAIQAVVVDGILWISQNAGGAQRNYCGDVVTGRALAPFPVTDSTVFLTADSHYVYLDDDPGLGNNPPKSVVLFREPIDPRCR